MIRIYCSRADATLQETETLTAGMVNTPVVQFTFSSDWNGLGKSAIVRAGTVIKEVIVSNDQIIVPSECLAKAGVNLIIGVWGGNFTTELPTVWCACGEIQDATNPSSALNHEDGTASNVAQMLAAAERAEAALEKIENANWSDVAERVIESADIGAAVGDWLDEHPEATTTVENKSLTLEKLHDGLVEYIDKKHRGGSITPVYVGDYLQSGQYLPSAVIRIGNYFYTISAPNEEYAIANSTNTGIVRKFDLVNNIEVTEAAFTTDVGHANAIAYDPDDECIYVAPIMDYSNGRADYAMYLYKFDLDMTPLGMVNTPIICSSITYDWKARKLYAYVGSQTTHPSVYVKENDEWILYSTIDMSAIIENEKWERYYNQNFAVYDDEFYISSPFGNVVYGKLESGSSTVIGSYTVNKFDSDLRFRLGELEGFEFTSDGRLYAIEYIIISSEGDTLKDVFITEIPVGHNPPHSTNLYGGLFTASNATYSLQEDSQTAFALSTIRLRSVQQLVCMLNADTITRIEIPANNVIEEPNIPIRILQDICIDLKGTYITSSLNVLKGKLELYVSNANARLEFKENGDGGFKLSRTGNLTIAGSQRLLVKTPENVTDFKLINPAYSYALIITRSKPQAVDDGVRLLIGGNEVEASSMYIGTYKLQDLSS